MKSNHHGNPVPMQALAPELNTGDYGAAGADVGITPPGASGRTIQRIT